MDQSKQQDCFLISRLPMMQIKRRFIETIFAIIGYFAFTKTSIPTIFGTLLGGVIGMIIAQLIFPEECCSKKVTDKLDAG